MKTIIPIQNNRLQQWHSHFRLHYNNCVNSINSISNFLLCSALILVLTGCAIKRAEYATPAYHLPDQFKNQTVDSAASSSVNDFHINAWWLLFGSSELSGLIEQGMSNNLDIRIAALHISQAKIRADQAHAAQLPTLDLALSTGPQHGNGPSQTTSGASLNAAWNVDVWGEQASLADEANFQLWQAMFDASNMKRTVAANIASSYVDYLLSNDRLKIARETEHILSELLVTMEKRAAIGDATLLELEQQRSAIFAERSLIPSLEQQREEAIESIAFLLGTVPSAIKLSDANLDSVHLPDAVPGLPSSLLLRRPDVRSMEARLLAADADVDVARARLLPAFNLSAQVGYSGLLSQLFQPASFFWNMFSNITANIFDDGKHAAEVEHAKLVHEEMIQNYAKTILQAVREVESALFTIRSSEQRTQLQMQAVSSANKAWEISNKMYLIGGVDFMALQDTVRTYQRNMEDSQRIRADYYRGYINLFQALGGGEDIEKIPNGRKLASLNKPAVEKMNEQHLNVSK